MTCKFFRDESGSAAIEYALLGALIALGAILALEALGSSLGELFGGVTAKLDGAKPK